MNKLNRGHSFPLIILILTFISMILTATIFYVSVGMSLSNVKIKQYSEWEGYYAVLDNILEKVGGDVRDDYTSPYDGWFSFIPENIDGYKIECFPEDSKLDINHVELKNFFDIQKDKSKQDDKTVFTEETDEYFYYPIELKPLMNDKKYDEYVEYFSIYNVPNVNTAGLDRIELYLKSQMLSDDKIKSFIDKIEKFRNDTKLSNYLKYKGTKREENSTGRKEIGLIIKENEFELLKNEFNDKEFDSEQINMMFDYKGRINLNFVDEKIFEIAVKACGPKNVNYNKYWTQILSKRESETTLKEMDIKNIFGVKDWRYYEKIFSIDSKMIRIKITRDDKYIDALVRRYKMNEWKTKILKISNGRL